MAEKELSMRITELKKLLKTEKFVLGTSRTLKLLKNGNAEQVFISSNCPDDIKKDIEYYAAIANTSVILLKEPNDELGILCKKPYPVSVLSKIKNE